MFIELFLVWIFHKTKLSSREVIIIIVGIVVALTTVVLVVFLNQNKGYCNARARLYFNTDLKGDYDDYDSNYRATWRDCGCLYYDEWAQRAFQSVETYDTCVRIFTHAFCKGQSLAVYPGSPMAPNLQLQKPGELKGMSVGCCLPEEFENSTFRALLPPDWNLHSRDEETDLAVFDTYYFAPKDNRTGIPDLKTNPGFLYFHDFFPLSAVRDVDASSIPTVNAGKYYVYQRPANDDPTSSKFPRTEQIYQTNISLANFWNPAQQEPIPSKILDYYRTVEQHAGDTLGFFVPLEFGGPSNVTFNVFPMSFAAKAKMAAVVSKIQNYLFEKSKRSVRLGLAISYENKHSTRPLGFTYRIQDEKNRELFVSYGVVLNN